MNKIMLLGRITKEIELKTLGAKGTPCCNFTLAVNRKFAKDGEQQADFIPIQAWGKTAEFCAKYFTKGQQIALCGRLQVRKWEDKEGAARYSTEVVAEEVYFAENKRTQEQHSEPVEQGEIGITEPATSKSYEDDLPF